MVHGGTPQAELWRLSFQQGGQPTVRAGLLAERDLQAFLASSRIRASSGWA
jgi:hypothetical protein